MPSVEEAAPAESSQRLTSEIPPCTDKSQLLLPFQVGSYCLLTLQSRIAVFACTIQKAVTAFSATKKLPTLTLQNRVALEPSVALSRCKSSIRGFTCYRHYSVISTLITSQLRNAAPTPGHYRPTLARHSHSIAFLLERDALGRRFPSALMCAGKPFNVSIFQITFQLGRKLINWMAASPR